MAGTVHGMVNKTFPRIADSNYSNCVHTFAAFAQFFDHLSTPAGGSIMTRISSHYGGGTGFDYPGGANPVGYTAPMGVWKMNTSTQRPGGGSAIGEVYIFIAAFTIATSEPQDFGLTIAGSGNAVGKAGMQIAFAEDGSNPWKGGVANVGGDRPADPLVWDAGASTLHMILPRSCAPGGVASTNRDNMAQIVNNMAFDILEGYFHGFADDDNFIVFFSGYQAVQEDDDPREYSALCFGLGELQPNCGVDPYFCYSWVEGGDVNGMPFARGQTHGDSAGTNRERNGGMKSPRGDVHTAIYSVFHTGLDETRSPNEYSSNGLIREEQATYCYTAAAWLGYGHEPSGTDFWRIIYGVPNEALDATNKRAAFGIVSLLTEKVTVAWPDSIGEAPGATRTPAGVAF